MKYLALLIDSFRESMDSKVLYFTFGLSTLVLLVTATTYFPPMSAKDQAEALVFYVDGQARSLNPMSKSGRASYELIEATQLNDAKEPWRQKHRLVIKVTLPKGDVSMMSSQDRILFTTFLYAQFDWMKNKNLEKESEFHPDDRVPGEGTGPARLISQALGAQSLTPVGGLLAPTTQILIASKVAELDEIALNQRKTKRVFIYTITHDGSKVDSRQRWMHTPQLLFGLLPLSKIPLIGYLFVAPLDFTIYNIERGLVSAVGGNVIVLIGIIVTAGFVPNMLQKGTVDLLISKPVSRPVILLFKYFGGLTFVMVNSLFIVFGLWLIFGLKTGVWSNYFLLTPFIITFFFAILYSLSVIFGVLFRNALLCILFTCIFWALIFGIGVGYGYVNPERNRTRMVPTEEGLKPQQITSRGNGDQNWLVTMLGTFHTILPRTGELGTITSEVISKDIISDEDRSRYDFDQLPTVNYWETGVVSVIFITVMLTVACLRFYIIDF